MTLNGKSILLAWELGEGLGHLPSLKAIALAVKAEGAVPVFALRDAVMTRTALKETNAQILPAPFWPMPSPPPRASGTYADILAANGFSSASHVQALVEAWDQIIDVVKPDLVVCEHAPAAALSAYGRIPVAMVGNGFVVPPADGDEFPPNVAGRGEPQRQRPVLTAIQNALADLGRRTPATICEPFRGAFRGIYSFPALDHYRHVRREAVLGPIEPVPPLAPLPAKRALFAYAATDYALINQVTEALMTLGSEASAYFRGSLGARASVLTSRGVTLLEQAPRLAEVLPSASVVFSHGGMGFANAAFAAGRPHIVSPRHLEAHSTALALQELGTGVCLHPFDPNSFREAVRRANEDSDMRTAAQSAAAAAHAFIAKSKAVENTLASLRRLFG